MKKIIYILLLTIIFTLLYGCKKEHTTKINEENYVIDTEFNVRNSNRLVYSLFNVNGEIYTDKDIDISKNSKFHKVLSIHHNYTEDVEYLITIFSDYKQISFKANGKESKKNITFKMKGNSHKAIDIETDLKQASEDLTILIVRNPDSNVKDFDSLLALEEINGLRFSIINEKSKQKKPLNEKLSILKEDYKSNSAIDTGAFISSDKKELDGNFEVKMSHDLYLHVGNLTNENISFDYIPIILNNWIQSNKNINISQHKYNSRKSYHLNFYKSDKKASNFQVILLPINSNNSGLNNTFFYSQRLTLKNE